MAGTEGTSVMKLAHANGVNIEGACEGSLACTTCHVHVDPKDLNKLTPAVEK